MKGVVGDELKMEATRQGKKVSEGTFFLGSFGVPKTISLYLVKGDEPALIESGPSSISNEVCRRLNRLGVSPTDVSYILLTHVHIDHAGGAWSLLERMPKARVMLHPQGVRHLVDPSRLYASASKVLGDVLKKWGEVRPVHPSRILEASDGQTVNLGGLELKLVDAPGHAPHQIAIYDETNRVLFPGDAMGIYHSRIDVIIPTSPPPNFDLELAIQTIRKLSNLRVEALCLSHFGPIFDVKPFFQRVLHLYRRWGKIIAEDSNRYGELDHLVNRIAQEFTEYSTLMRDSMGKAALKLPISGYINYFERKGVKSI